MKDCPWCHIDPNEIAALKQRLTRLEKLAEAQARDAAGPVDPWDNCSGGFIAEALGAHGNGSRIMKLVDSFSVGVDFSTILAAFKRLVKIEEAARGVGAERDRRGK